MTADIGAIRRLLIVRLGSLGDLIHTLPAVNAIRRRHPRAEIDWLVDAAHRDLLDLVPILSTVVVLRDRTAGGWLEARGALRARQYDVAIDFQGLLKSAGLARLSGARRVLGFDREGLREPMAALLYTETARVGEGHHIIDKNLRLAASVGARADAIEFPIGMVLSDALNAVRARGVTRFALLNCGAAWPNKRWPPDRFGRIAAWLRDRHGLSSLVLWGPGEEGLAADVAAASLGAATVAPATRVPDLVAFCRAAQLMISGDTGPTHIAAAVGTPVVALFGPTDPGRNGPWNAHDLVISRYDSCECHYERRCKRSSDAWCLGTIAEGDVRAAIDRRLA